jgi:hypothetical protein
MASPRDTVVRCRQIDGGVSRHRQNGCRDGHSEQTDRQIHQPNACQPGHCARSRAVASSVLTKMLTCVAAMPMSRAHQHDDLAESPVGRIEDCLVAEAFVAERRPSDRDLAQPAYERP